MRRTLFASLIFTSLLLTACGGGGGGGSSPAPAPAVEPAADTVAPVITLSGAQEITLTSAENYEEAGATATDDVDGSVDVTIAGSVGTAPGTYTLTYTATDAAGNEASTTRTVIVEPVPEPDSDSATETVTLTVFSGGSVGADWDLGLNAYDEGIDFALCENDNGAGCPNIDWEIINDGERGAVLQISHNSAGLITGIFTKASSPLDLSAYAGGSLKFDARVVSGDPNLTMKIDCVYPCTSGDYDLGPVSTTDWQSFSIPIDSLVAQDLDLTQVDTGIVIWATGFTDTIFLIDNVRWETGADADESDTEDSVGDQPWRNPNLDGPTSPTSYAGYTLRWADEFDGMVLDESQWNFEIGTGVNGWGNNELQYYRRENTQVTEGLLVITAKAENFGGRSYTSSRLTTQDKFTFRYGRVDIRAAMPRGKGLWPALWMLGASFATVGWPASGEIDIMEMVGGSGGEDTVYGTAHWDNAGAAAQYGGSTKLPPGQTLDSSFHVFSLTWDENQLNWFIDDILYHTMDIDDSPGLAAFREEFFLIVNVAVGGDWPGPPNANTEFPQHMLVDYIRVFQAN